MERHKGEMMDVMDGEIKAEVLGKAFRIIGVFGGLHEEDLSAEVNTNGVVEVVVNHELGESKLTALCQMLMAVVVRKHKMDCALSFKWFPTGQWAHLDIHAIQRRAATHKRFELHRMEDETGVSGTGHIADGVRFEDGTCVVRWRTQHRSTAVYADVEDVVAIHGHGGKTRVCWVD